jgi:hypothetical protein
MNSLESYKNQCYNVGSPSPNPIKSPLVKFPRKLDLDSEFEFPAPLKPNPKTVKSKTKVCSKIPTLPTPRKRRAASQESSTSSPKKPRIMNHDEMSKMFSEQFEKQRLENQENFARHRKENQEDMDKTVKAAVETAVASLNINSRMDGFSNKLDAISATNNETNIVVQQQMSGFQDQIRTLQSSVDDNRIKLETELVTLKGQFNLVQENAMTGITNKEDIEDIVIPMVESLVPKVSTEVKRDILSPVKATWNAIQAEKVHEHDHSIVVFGYKVDGNTMEAAGKLLKDELKVSEDDMLKISIKQAYRLGKGANNKAPPFLIKFGHPSERNMVLSYTKNLKGKKIKVERDVPKNYQEQHKVFKDLSWKLKTMPDFEFQTQIVFDGHLMVLRYRTRDTSEKYHWTIHSSWEPPMDSKATEKTSFKTPAGSKASPAPDPNAIAKANAAIFMTIKDLTEQHTGETVKDKLDDYLKAEHKVLVREVKVTKRPDLYIVYCDSWTSAKTISTTYKAKLIDHEVSFSLFAQKDPAQQH